MASVEISVAVERAVHDALKAAAQRIFDEHGIRVDEVNLQWLNVSTSDRIRYRVIETQARTTCS